MMAKTLLRISLPPALQPRATIACSEEERKADLHPAARHATGDYCRRRTWVPAHRSAVSPDK
jgi:hypothetical protein